MDTDIMIISSPIWWGYFILYHVMIYMITEMITLRKK